MLNDEKIAAFVKDYDGSLPSYRCILYACVTAIRVPDMDSIPEYFLKTICGENVFVILTLDGNQLSLYPLSASLKTQVMGRFDIPLGEVNIITNKKSSVWNTMRIFLQDGGKLELTISNKTLGIRRQQENAKTFLSIISYLIGE